MKRLLALAALASATLPASAVVSISWFNNDIVLVQEGAQQNPAPAGWLVQLIWSPDNIASPVNGVNPVAPTEGEEVLFSQGLGPSAGNFDGNGGNVIDVADTKAGGFVYTRVFNVPFGSPNTPTMWGTSSNVGNDNTTVANPLGALTVTVGNDPNSVNFHAAQGVLVVPEPGTLAFAGVGALAFGIRHFRRRA